MSDNNRRKKSYKQGQYWNCLMRQDVYDTLDRLAKESGMTKTSIVERAILRTAKEFDEGVSGRP